MGYVPSRIVGTIWIDGEASDNRLAYQRFTLGISPPTQVRFTVGNVETAPSFVYADTQRLLSELQTVYEGMS